MIMSVEWASVRTIDERWEMSSIHCIVLYGTINGIEATCTTSLSRLFHSLLIEKTCLGYRSWQNGTTLPPRYPLSIILLMPLRVPSGYSTQFHDDVFPRGDVFEWN